MSFGCFIAGTGSFLPPATVTNAAITQVAGHKDPEWISRKLGIEERRLQLQPELLGWGPYTPVPEVEMAALAAEQALDDAGLAAADIDGVWYISCTQPESHQYFSRQVFRLHQRLGLRADAFALEINSGCGGATHVMAMAVDLIASGRHRSVLIVASNAPSQHYANWREYVDNDTWLSMYLFGDGAGAMLLVKGDDTHQERGVLATYIEVDPTHELMYFRRSGTSVQAMYEIDAKRVKALFPIYMQKAMDGLHRKHPFTVSEITRFYFHQVNGKLLDAFARSFQIPRDRVARNIDRYGNLAAAATLVLLDEDRRSQKVRKEDLCIFCTVGAGAQYGAALVRL